MKFSLVDKENGFTLVEIAIVLVIIGVLFGAILRGENMIKSAKEKSLDNKIRFAAAAQFTYYDRTGRYAGDTTATPDGLIDVSATAWTELQTQNIVTANDQNHAFNGTFTFGHDATTYPNNNYICASNVPSWVAQSFDTKMDDGVGTTGSVRWSAAAGVAYPADPNTIGSFYWFFDR